MITENMTKNNPRGSFKAPFRGEPFWRMNTIYCGTDNRKRGGTEIVEGAVLVSSVKKKHGALASA